MEVNFASDNYIPVLRANLEPIDDCKIGQSATELTDNSELIIFIPRIKRSLVKYWLALLFYKNSNTYIKC